MVHRAWLGSFVVVSNLFGAGLLVAACSDGGGPAAEVGEDDPRANIPARGPWQQGLAIPAEKQKLGDAKKGRDLILNGGYMGCGIPARLLDNPLLGGFVGSALGPSGNGTKIPGRNAKNEPLSYTTNSFTTTDGVDVVNVGCLMCHAGSFNGELVLGLGVADADFTGGFGGGAGGMAGGGGAGGALPSNLTGLLGLTPGESENLNKMLTRSTVFNAITAMRTIGQNPAEAMAITLMAHRNEDLSWSDEPVVPWEFKDHKGKTIEPEAFPSDVPPWWRAKKKNGLFYNAMARGDHSGSMALATSICVDTVAQAKLISAMFEDMHAFVLTLEAPKYPFKIDKKLAAQGEPVFIEHCAGCHGTYGKTDDEDTYPNLLFPLEFIGTDGVIAEGGVVYAPQLVEGYNRTYYGKVTPFIVDDPAVGYVAPPLDGVWATGPFLHNGSVPSIELVLNSKARPKFWKRTDLDSTNFDEASLGFPHEKVGYGQDDASEEERKSIYDTTKFGQGNRGHIYGDQLSKGERRAVLEYLKTL